MKKLRITVDGKPFEVTVESLDEPGTSPVSALPLQQTSVAAPLSQVAKPAASAAPAGPGSVPSPLAGRIVSVDCQIGQKVAAGDKLITVEAMKMNTFVNAPSDGTVATVTVQPGDAVEEGQVLVTLS